MFKVKAPVNNKLKVVNRNIKLFLFANSRETIP